MYPLASFSKHTCRVFVPFHSTVHDTSLICFPKAFQNVIVRQGRNVILILTCIALGYLQDMTICDSWPELEAVAAINTAIRLGNAAETAEELMNPEAQLPIVYQTAANLYQAELFSLQLQGGRVRHHVYNFDSLTSGHKCWNKYTYRYREGRCYTFTVH